VRRYFFARPFMTRQSRPSFVSNIHTIGISILMSFLLSSFQSPNWISLHVQCGNTLESVNSAWPQFFLFATPNTSPVGEVEKKTCIDTFWPVFQAGSPCSRGRVKGSTGSADCPACGVGIDASFACFLEFRNTFTRKSDIVEHSFRSGCDETHEAGRQHIP
jgi:hypothetical protein